jgi:hypothetical protein
MARGIVHATHEEHEARLEIAQEKQEGVLDAH